MKKHFTALILASLFLILIPLFIVKLNAPNNEKQSYNSKNEISGGLTAEMLAYEFREEYCREGLKALAIILNSNYKAGVKLKNLSKTEFIKKHKNGAYHYSLLENTVKETADYCVTYKAKAVIIPYSYVTNGKCENDYAYLRNTANPRDFINPEYKFNSPSGVSLYSINELCKKGLSCEESLSRYFADTKITAVGTDSG